MKEIFKILRIEHSFRKLFFARFIGGIGDWFSSVAILSLLLQITGTGLAVGITLASRTLPFLVMGPIGGILADRFNKKYILIISDIARACLVLAFLLVDSVDNVWIVYVTTIGIVMFSALSMPARSSIIPRLVSSKNINVANSLEQLLSGVVMTFGAAFGGIVASTLGSDTAFIINSCTFLISGLICFSIRYPVQEESYTTKRERDEGWESAPAPSFWMVFRKSRLIQIVSLQALLWPIGGGAINVLISVYGYQVYKAGDSGVGILYGALGIGFLISGFIAHRFKKWIRQAVFLATVVEGTCHILFSQSPSLWFAALFVILATVGAGIGNVSVNTLIMHTVPKEVHGRAFALCDTTSSVMIALSMVGTGVLLNFYSPQTIGFTAGLVIVITSLAAIPLLRMKITLPEDEEISNPATLSEESSQKV